MMSELDFFEMMNSTSDYEFEIPEADRRLELIVSIVVPIFFSLIGITGFIGNLLVVITVSFNEQMRSTTNLLISNLAIADLLFICCCIPFTAVNYGSGQWLFGLTWCKVVQYLINVTVYTSIYTLVLMSIDRFLAVRYPTSRIRNERNTLLAIAILWIAVLTVNLPVFHAYGLIVYNDGYNEEISVCTFIDNEFLTEGKLYISMFASGFLLPLIIIFLFILVLRCNLSQSKRSEEVPNVTRLVIVVIMCYAILWLPFQTIQLLKTLDLYQITQLTVVLQIVAQVLACISSCINPFLYTFLSENFRKSFVKVTDPNFLDWCINSPF